jgi:hypothetical protein
MRSPSFVAALRAAEQRRHRNDPSAPDATRLGTTSASSLINESLHDVEPTRFTAEVRLSTASRRWARRY